MFSRNIHAFMCTEYTIVHYFCVYRRTFYPTHFHVNSAIIEQDVVTDFQITCKFRKRYIDKIVSCLYIRTAYNLYSFTCFVLNRFIYIRRANFRPLSINQDANMG